MKVQVKLTSPSDNVIDIVNIENVENLNDFEYSDNDLNKCHMSIFDDGLVLLKQCKDYSLHLHLKDSCYVTIKSSEGELKLA